MDSNRNLEIGWSNSRRSSACQRIWLCLCNCNSSLAGIGARRNPWAAPQSLNPRGDASKEFSKFWNAQICLEIEETGATYRYALLLLEVSVQFDFRWINLKSIPEAEQEKFEEVNPKEWPVNNVPWTHADHILSATNADAEKAELLSLAERDALFVIQHRTWSKENLVTYVRLYYPGLFYDKRKTRFPEKIFCESLEIFMWKIFFPGFPLSRESRGNST